MDQMVIHILYIEDDEDDFIIMKDMLSQIASPKYILEWCINPDEILSKLNSQKYDLCFLDYNLGALNGIDVIKKIEKYLKDIPVIFITGQADSEIDQKAMKAGAVDYLVKGRIRTESLERIIRYTLSNQNAEKIRREKESLQNTKELAAAVAHEFGQPLQALSNYYDLIKSGPNGKQYINKIGDQIYRIQNLTEKLRNITQLEKKKYVDTQILDITRSSDNVTLVSNDRILIVDDEEAIKETMVEMFKLRGFNAEGVSNGYKALELFKKYNYKIIISDLMMDGMNGVELFKKVRSINKKVFFIFITGYEITDELKNSISEADGLLTKPFSIKQFFDMFEQVLQH